MSEAFLDTLPGLLVANARHRPTGVATRVKALGIWQEMTYAQYLERVRAVALALDEIGLEKGGRAAIISDNEPNWLVADLAIQATGAYSVGVYPTQVAAEVAYILEHAACSVVFCGDQEQIDKVLEHRDRLPGLKRIVCFDMKGVSAYHDPMIESMEDLEARGRARDQAGFDALLARLDPEDIALVGYTSGTTGKPKGALVRHRNQVTMARHFVDWAKLGPKDRDFSYFPLCHPAVRVVDCYSMLACGGSINFPESTEDFTGDMVEISPTLILGTPRVFERYKAAIQIRMLRAFALKRWVYARAQSMLDARLERRLAGQPSPLDPILGFLGYWLAARWLLDKLGLLRLRYGSCGGASTAPELLKFFWSMGVPIYETYGQTETSGVAFSQRNFGDVGTAGVPLPDVDFRIAPSGELEVRGAGVFAGYLDDPEKTAAAFDGDWYRTGDIAHLDGDGRLVVLDREKHVLKKAGAGDLSPSEIENKIKLSPYISDAMVLGGDRPFVGALVEIDYNTVSDWAGRKGIAYTTYRSLTEAPAVVALVQEAVDDANRFLPEPKRVRGFRLFPRELDPDADELTPTRKIKRETVGNRFADLIDDLYKESLQPA